MTTRELHYEITEGTGWITFNRPDQRNALTFAMYEGLAEICANAPTDGSVKAIVIQGAGGRAFAAGTDMTQFRGFATPQDAFDYEDNMGDVLDRIERCPVPTIAAITGACTGGGAAIAACCDLRIADSRLKFGFPIARTLGNCLSVANLARLVALLGAGRTREIIFTSRLVRAEEALTAGLVSEILDDHAALMARARSLAETLAEQAPLTLRATKEGLRRLAQRDVEDSDLILSCYTSEDFREGLEAFLAKRKPDWQGR